MKTAEKLPTTRRRAGTKHTATTAPIIARVMATVIRGFFILTSILEPRSKTAGNGGYYMRGTAAMA